MSDITREGYLFTWNLPNLPACQTEWPSFRHDQQQSGNYDRDGTPPYKPTNLSLNGGVLGLTAPGDDNGCGTATRYEIATSDSPIGPQNFAAAQQLPGPPAPQAAGSNQTYTLPSHQRYVAVRAIDDAGNAGWDALLDTAAGSAGSRGGGSGAQAQKRGPCANTRRGTGKGNRLQGSRLGDLLRGLGGNDRISGRRGADCIYGNRGDDRLKGGLGRDKIYGGPGNDRIFAAGQGRDRVICGPGDDVAVIHRGDRVRGCETVRRR
jgi:Ca2+-binding RTX toxin-like protein